MKIKSTTRRKYVNKMVFLCILVTRMYIQYMTKQQLHIDSRKYSPTAYEIHIHILYAKRQLSQSIHLFHHPLLKNCCLHATRNVYGLWFMQSRTPLPLCLCITSVCVCVSMFAFFSFFDVLYYAISIMICYKIVLNSSMNQNHHSIYRFILILVLFSSF